MTRENRRRNLALEIERGRKALKAAAVLQGEGCHEDAISRAYYAMLHHARALLLTEGLESRSHGGVTHLLHLHFVRTGRFEPALARLLSRQQGEREEADYDSAAVFTAEDAEEARRVAERFCGVVLEVLGRDGWLEG